MAERLLADPGSRSYGIPSVVRALHASGSVAFGAPPSVFYPTPSVESTVVDLVRRSAPGRAEQAIELATVAFGQRRKMLRRSLAGIVPDAVSVLERCGIDPTLRPEDISPDDFVTIATEVHS